MGNLRKPCNEAEFQIDYGQTDYWVSTSGQLQVRTRDSDLDLTTDRNNEIRPIIFILFIKFKLCIKG